MPVNSEVPSSRVGYSGLRLRADELAKSANALHDIATRKGALCVTQTDGSDKLVGFFVPAEALIEVGRCLVNYRKAKL